MCITERVSKKAQTEPARPRDHGLADAVPHGRELPQQRRELRYAPRLLARSQPNGAPGLSDGGWRRLIEADLARANSGIEMIR